MMRAPATVLAILAITTHLAGLDRGTPPDVFPVFLAVVFVAAVGLWLSALGRAGGRRG